MSSVDVSHVRLIAQMEVRRRYRAIRDRPTQLVALIISAAFLLIPMAGIAFAAYLGGTQPQNDLVGLAARTAPPVVWLLVSLFLGLRVLTDTADPDNLDGYLTTIDYRELFFGVAAVESLGAFGYLGLPVLLAAGGFALGSGSLLVAVTILTTGVTAVALGIATGLAVGFAVKNVAVRSELVARYRVLLWSIVFVLYMGAFVSGGATTLFDPALQILSRPPLSWLGAFALLPVAPDASAVRGVTALAVAVVATVGLFAAAVRLAGLLWYTDGVSLDGDGVGDGETSLDAGPLGRIVGRQTAWVARTTLTRARRAPIRLLYVAYPVFLLAPMVTQAIETGTVPPTLAPTAALYVAWAGGAAFALNPLGEQGATLPVTITTGVPGRSFLRGILLPGIVLGGGSGALLAGGLAALAGGSPFRIGLLAVAGAVLGVFAPALASGVGVILPKYEASRITRSHEAVVPSLFAFAAYSLLLVTLAAPGLALQSSVVANLLGELLGVSSTVVSAVGVVATTVLIAVVGYFSYRLAVSRFERFTME